MLLSIDRDLPTESSHADIDTSSSSWKTLYSSCLWKNSELRRDIINKNQFCNTTRKVYEIKEDCRDYESRKACNSQLIFKPSNHSTPRRTINNEVPISQIRLNSIVEEHQINPLNMNQQCCVQENNHTVPSISRQIDSAFTRSHKYSSSEVQCNRSKNRRLKKNGIKGIRCIVSLAITDESVNKRTQIQACSISVMIVAIIIISFVLVNWTNPNYKLLSLNNILVPTNLSEHNRTSAVEELNMITHPAPMPNQLTTVPQNVTTHNSIDTTTGKPAISKIISKILQSIRTYPKDGKVKFNDTLNQSMKPKDINNRDLSHRFCTCQINEVCMLDEDTGTATCKKALDITDPTGCGGLCAMETEACQLVDRARGVRVCRLLSLVTCADHEWRCRNGLCVPASARCDGNIHCYDKSDEMYCDCDLSQRFRCGHAISCFHNDKLCDGVIDCYDGFDEVNCTAECPKEQFTCTDGQCILGAHFCDGLVDCADASDEPHGCDSGCSAHEFRCSNSRCIPRSTLCDGVDQCGDSSDETSCS